MSKRVLLVDDHSVVITGTRIMLTREIAGLEFEDATNGDTAMKKILSNPEDYFDLLILDINMPGFDSYHFVSTIKILRPSAPILIFSMNPEDVYAQQYIKLGVKGYVNKESSSDVLVAAVLRLLEGGVYFSMNSLYKAVVSKNGRQSNAGPLEDISPREFEVMNHLIKGAGITEISRTLNIATSTVATHKARIFEKLAVKNTIELAKLVEANPVLMAQTSGT